MKRLGKHAAAMAAALAFSTAAFCADIALPAPQTSGGQSIFTLLKSRHSAVPADFPLKAISAQELSNLLWAATGQNRPNGWTIPLAMHRPPYNKIYVLDDSGVYQYDWKQNRLAEISGNNIKTAVSRQSIAGQSAVILVFVSDNNVKKEHAYTATGAMTQNIYLAAESMGIEGRFVMSMNEDILRQKLKLTPDEFPLNMMLIGKK